VTYVKLLTKMNKTTGSVADSVVPTFSPQLGEAFGQAEFVVNTMAENMNDPEALRRLREFFYLLNAGWFLVPEDYSNVDQKRDLDRATDIEKLYLQKRSIQGKFLFHSTRGELFWTFFGLSLVISFILGIILAVARM